MRLAGIAVTAGHRPGTVRLTGTVTYDTGTPSREEVWYEVGDQYREDLSSSGNPWLAQGGSGDVLAGFMAGLLAQPTLQVTPNQAIQYAVWKHGTAADHLTATRPHWVVEQLVEVLGSHAGKGNPTV